MGHSEETKRKIAEAVKRKWEDPEYQKRVKSKKDKRIEKQKETWKRKLLEEDWNELSYERKRRRLLVEQDYKCNKCGLDKWLEEPIKLEFEHIDGDTSNNERENCEALCPNCHSMTETWRGHNKTNLGGGKKKVTESEFVESLKNNDTIRQALLKLGLSAKGNNYKRAKKIIMKYDI